MRVRCRSVCSLDAYIVASDRCQFIKQIRCSNEYAYNAFGKCADVNQLLSRLGGGQNRGCDEEPVPDLHVGECLTGFGIQKDARDVRRHQLIYDSENEWPHRHDS